MFLISVAHAAEPAHAAAEPTGLQNPEIWVAVAFVVVVGLIGRKAWAAIIGGLDAHSAKIASKLDEARKLREDAQALLVDYQRRHTEAVAEADAIVTFAHQEAELVKQQAESELTNALARREAQAVERIAQAEAQALARVRALTVDVAMAAATRLLGEKLTPEQSAALVQSAISQLPRVLN